MNALRALVAAYRTPSVGRHTSKAVRALKHSG